VKQSRYLQLLPFLLFVLPIDARDRFHTPKKKRAPIADALRAEGESWEPTWKKQPRARKTAKAHQAERASRADVERDACLLTQESFSRPAVEELMQPKVHGIAELSTHEMQRERARRAVRTLVDRGAEYFTKHVIADACSAFSHTKDFVEGERYVFVFDERGTCFAHGEQTDLIWQNLYDKRDSFGSYPIREIIAKAQEGGGWVSYEWRGVTKSSYVRPVLKNGVLYAVGAGYYPYSKEDSVVALVRGAAESIAKAAREGTVELALSEISYPIGPFVDGDLYPFVLDVHGRVLAHARRPHLVGLSAWREQDARGRYHNQELITELQTARGRGTWIEYMSRGARKLLYGQLVAGVGGREYVVACGYYPDETHEQAKELVRRGHAFVKQHGQVAAAREFNDERSLRFRDGALSLFLFDMDGVCLAYGENSQLVGRNLYDMQDEEGAYFVREILERALTGGGWVSAKLRNLFQSIYVEVVEIGGQRFAVGSGFYPASKSDRARLLAKSAISYLQNNPTEQAFGQMVKRDGSFIRGSLRVFAFDREGICHAYGDRHTLLWRDLREVTDDEGVPFIKELLAETREGPATISYHLNSAPVVAYAEPVTKDGVDYVIGSSHYELAG